MQKEGRCWLPLDVRVLSDMIQVLKREKGCEEGFGDKRMNTPFYGLSIALSDVLLSRAEETHSWGQFFQV